MNPWEPRTCPRMHPRQNMSPIEAGPTLESLESRLLLAAANVTKLRILDAGGVEGSLGVPGRIVFTIRRLGNLAVKSVTKFRTVALGTVDAAVFGTDLAFRQGRLVFKPGQKKQNIIINLIGNAAAEDARRFSVELFKPKKTKYAKKFGVGTISDDDSLLPQLSINDVHVIEGNSGTKTINFNVTLSKASADPITVEYKSSAGSAISPEDYIAVPLQTLTFNPGQTFKQISVQIVGDTIPAQSFFETFFITLTNLTNATIAKAIGTGTIEDND